MDLYLPRSAIAYAIRFNAATMLEHWVSVYLHAQGEYAEAAYGDDEHQVCHGLSSQVLCDFKKLAVGFAFQVVQGVQPKPIDGGDKFCSF